MTLCYTVLILLFFSFFLEKEKVEGMITFGMKYLSLHVREKSMYNAGNKGFCEWMTVPNTVEFMAKYDPFQFFPVKTFSLLYSLFAFFFFYLWFTNCVVRTNSKRVNKALTTFPKSKRISNSSSSCFSFFF